MALKVLVITPFYEPGFKGGGPIRSIKNLVDKLGNEFEFLVVTKDRDLGDQRPYDLERNKWLQVGLAKVFYVNNAELTVSMVDGFIRNESCDVLYLNSFFSFKFSIQFLLAVRLFKFKRVPIVLAPRGEFSSGALKLKSFKKKVYIAVAKTFGLYRSVVWQGSTELEAHDIHKTMNIDLASIVVAKNLPAKPRIASGFDIDAEGRIRIVFLSRIAPKKNLAYALSVLREVSIQVEFDIYGPKEDVKYWDTCFESIGLLPSNINVNYHGAIHSDRVSDMLSRYDLFFFPTMGENYGHVIAESLAAGTPVLISDQTPWCELEKDGIGWAFPLDDRAAFIRVIQDFHQYSDRSDHRKLIQKQALKRIYSHLDIEANRKLFLFAFDAK